MVSGHAGVFSVDILEGKPHTLSEFRAVANKRDPALPPGSDAAKVERLFWKTVGLPKVSVALETTKIVQNNKPKQLYQE